MEQTLASLSITDDAFRDLKSAGYVYLRDLPQDLVDRKFTAEEWAKLKSVPKTKSALDLLEEESVAGAIYTFNQSLDDVLEGEFVAGNILELCGEPGSGKTQICLHLCVDAPLPEMYGGNGGEAVYICSNHNFSSSRLKEIATLAVCKISLAKPGDTTIKEDFKAEDILKKIHHYKVTTCEDLFAAIVTLRRRLRSLPRVRLVVIDSISPILDQVDYKERQRVVYKVFCDLQELGVKHDFLIIVTNNMTTRIESSSSVYTTASFGNSFFHRVNTRILLKKKSPTDFEATFLKSVRKPRITKQFQL